MVLDGNDTKTNPETMKYSLYEVLTLWESADLDPINMESGDSKCFSTNSKIIGQQDDSTHFASYKASQRTLNLRKLKRA